MKRLTAITGGIGAGKSVVSRMLIVMGYDVFDCDREAKLLMDSDNEIKTRLKAEIDADTVDSEGNINRAHLSSIVFTDAHKLEKLNSIVHGAVKKRICEWCEEKHSSQHLFVETAILYQSGLDKMVDDVIEVIAPDEIRIERVVKRNNCSATEVSARIKSQTFTPENRHSTIIEIVNDGFTAILPQVMAFLK